MAAARARAQTVALWRYTLIEAAMDAQLTCRQRGRVVNGIAGREHTDPFGTPVRVSRKTIDRWIRARRAGGFDALVPAPRNVTPRTEASVLELAVALKKDCDVKSHSVSKSVDWRSTDVDDVTSGQCPGPVPTVACVAGNGWVRSPR